MSEAPNALWNLAEAIAWVATRDPDVTARAVTEETENELIVMLIRAETSGVRAPAHAEGVVGPPRSVGSLPHSWAALAEAIASGRVRATGRLSAVCGIPQARAAVGVAALDVKPHSERHGFDGLFLSGENVAWHDVRIDAADTIRAFPRIVDDAEVQEHVVTYTTGLPGRPSTKHLYIPEAEQWLATDRQWKNTTAFAEDLRTWVRAEHPQAALPTAKTIRNHVGSLYRKFRPK